MADAEQLRPEEEEGVEAGLKAIAAVEVLPNNGLDSPTEVVNGHGLDRNGDADISDILEFDNIGSTSHEENGESSKSVGEVVEEEIVELEFEKVKPKLATHSMHCPNCKSEITKVTLRRKVLLHRPITPVVDPEPEPEPEPAEPEPPCLVGCLSCLSLFTCSETGRFNPFKIFQNTSEATPVSLASPPSTGGPEKSESCFSMFWVIRKSNQEPEDPQQSETVNVNPNPKPKISSSGPLQTHAYVTGSTSSVTKEFFGAPSLTLNQSSNTTGNDDSTIIIEDEPATIVVAQPRGRSWLGYDGLLAEILKSIIYGGLMEVIASLSVVASAAASDAATLSIISVALASLVGGVFVIGHNLWDLRDDCYKDSNNEAASKYKELLGQINYFPLHAFFAILSFLVFGMVPPVAYGYSFHETNDKDYTMVVVATSSLLCVALLAIFKAYINKCTILEYFKTVVYYITTAVSVSGVSYVAGNLLTRFMEEYGLFDTSSDGGLSSLLFHSTTPSLASF